MLTFWTIMAVIAVISLIWFVWSESETSFIVLMGVIFITFAVSWVASFFQPYPAAQLTDTEKVENVL